MSGVEPTEPGSSVDLVEQVVDYAVVALDPDGTIRSWNRGAQQAHGLTAEQAVGRNFAILHTEDDRRRGLPRRLLHEARRLGRVEHTGWRERPDGTRFWADVVITALQDPDGGLTGFAEVTRDVTVRHDLETRLQQSEERLRLLVGQVVDYAIIALDPEGIIETWNLGAERVKGFSSEEAIGRSFSMFYTEEDRRSGLPMRLLHEARRQGRVEHTGWRVRKDGSQFWGDVVITALHDEDGQLTGFAKVTRDRTDLKSLEDAQDAFYTVFSHDFRTPITAVKGFVDALRDAPEEARERLIGRVEASADRLLEMVGELVEFASARARTAALLLGDVDLADVARRVAREISPALEPDRVHVADATAFAWANGDAMHRVLTNLVVNALKYSPAGSPVEISFDRPAPGRLRVTVADRGRGIRAEDLDTIFEEFERGALAEEDGGTGLGLTSVRGLVGQQNGVVSIESEEGVGTSVSVVLPSLSAPRAPAPAQRTTSSPGVAVPGEDTSASSPTGHSAG